MYLTAVALIVELITFSTRQKKGVKRNWLIHQPLSKGIGFTSQRGKVVALIEQLAALS